MDLSGVALVTGGASGIGQAIALSFVREGCRRLILIDLNSEGLRETQQLALEIASETEIHIAQCDVSDEAAVEKVMTEAMAKFERLDYAVNCAGFPGGFNKTAEYEMKDFDRVQQVNVRGTWLCMRAQIQQMMKQSPLQPRNPKIPAQKGSIVNIASTAGLIGIKNLCGYVASKHAISGFTKVAAMEYGKEGIRVNAVCPGVIETNLGKDAPEELVRENLNPVIERTPLGRAGQPEEVAQVVCFLCSLRATYVNGSCMTVDGGFTSG